MQPEKPTKKKKKSDALWPVDGASDVETIFGLKN